MNHILLIIFISIPDSSVGKESACNAGGPGSIPGSGRSGGEGKGYPFQYPRASLVAQLVKNLPAMQETWVWSLCWEDPLGKGNATHPSILAWKIPWTEESGGLESMGFTKTQIWLSDFQSLTLYNMPQYLGSSFIINLFTYWSVPLFNIYV